MYNKKMRLDSLSILRSMKFNLTSILIQTDCHSAYLFGLSPFGFIAQFWLMLVDPLPGILDMHHRRTNPKRPDLFRILFILLHVSLIMVYISYYFLHYSYNWSYYWPAARFRAASAAQTVAIETRTSSGGATARQTAASL